MAADERGEEMSAVVEDPDAGAGSPHFHEAQSYVSDLESSIHTGTSGMEVRLRPIASSGHAHRPNGTSSSSQPPSPSAASGDACKARRGDGRTSDEADLDGESDSASLHKFWHRAGWLVLLLMCQSTSSVILEHFELLIRTHPVVIYFLTMLVGAGGNAGSQSTVLVVRRLALAAARGLKGNAGDRFSVRQIVRQEVSVGARLAFTLFCASFLRCIAFQVRGLECLAICLSMLTIVFTSTLAGAALPLLLSRFDLDPAHAGATIQVVMDISGVTLTCVVSCLVLGLPLTGEQAIHNATMAVASTVAPSFAPAHHPGGLAGARHSLNAFGADATLITDQSSAVLVHGKAQPLATHAVDFGG